MTPYEPRTDSAPEELIQRYVRGECDLRDEVIESLEPLMVRAVARTWNGPERKWEPIEDLVALVRAKVFVELPGFEWRGPGSLRAWVAKIVANVVKSRRDHWHAQCRDRKREVHIESAAGSGETRQLGPVPMDLVTASRLATWSEICERFLESLPSLLREACEAVLSGSTTGQDLAAQLDISVDAAYKRLSRLQRRWAEFRRSLGSSAG